MKDYWQYIGLSGEDIKEHYDHTLKIRESKDVGYSPCDKLFCYVLFCDDCKEDILVRAEGEKGYKCLKLLYKKQEQGCKISFDRIGGYYGRVGYSDGKNWVAVAESTDLY